MKKNYFLLIVLCVFNGVDAQIVSILDASFKAKLLDASTTSYIAKDFSDNAIKIDANNDGEIQVSEALQVSFLDIKSSLIASLVGIEKFSNLKYLYCSNNRLSSLNISGLTSLNYLNCSNNQLSSFDLSGTITSLECSDNQLTTLNLSGLNNLTNLNCSNNQLTTLNFSGLNKLKGLVCHNNQLPTLNLSGLINLTKLNCNKNKIYELDLTQLSNLLYLDCNENTLTNLNITGLNNLMSIDCSINKLTNLNVNQNLNLQDLYCSANMLTDLDLTGLSKLGFLGFYENQITTIDLTGLSELQYIGFFDNKITSIDFTSTPNLIGFDGGKNPIGSIDLSQLPNLENLWLGHTPIHSLDLSNLKKLKGVNVSNCPNLESINLKNGTTEDLNYLEPELLDYFKTDFSNFSNCPKLKYICGDEADLESISQKIASYNYTNCNVGGYCSFDKGGTNYFIQGNNRIDSNNNGCDVSDLAASNIKFTIYDGTETGTIITNESGNYSFPFKEGAFVITPIIENSTYFYISPTTTTVTFPTQVSPLIQDFCITANGVHPDIEITLLPIQTARPGFDAKYKLVYKNKGNTTQSGSVNLTFDDAVLDLVVSNPLITTQTTNNLYWNFTNLLPFKTREITFTLNVNSPMETPAVNDGSVLVYNATITSTATDETPTDNSFAFNQTVVNSFDPNDKTCLEGSTVSPSLIGQYVHYMIRFENTGTFPAENIVVKDIIDLSKFDISTLIPTSSSHSFVTNISAGNKVEFIFENINLPFDDANNDGYIAFKIKTKSTLVVNDTFTNDASIYFDYNFPVVTKLASSTYKTLATPDFEFSHYFTLYPNPAQSVLNISSKDTIEVQSISIYNTLGQLVLVVPNAEKVSKIDVSSLTTGNYFIKINSGKGTSNTRFIKE